MLKPFKNPNFPSFQVKSEKSQNQICQVSKLYAIIPFDKFMM